MYESVARIYTRGNFILSTKEKVKGKRGKEKVRKERRVKGGKIKGKRKIKGVRRKNKEKEGEE